MKKLILFCTLVLFALGFNACESYTIPSSGNVYTSFSASVVPIINSDCVSCHEDRDPVLTEGQAFNSLSNGGYIDTDNPESSSLYETLNGSHSSRISTEDKAIILDWIKAGAPND